MSQPDIRQPEIVLGSCEACGALYFVEESPIDSGEWRAIGRARSELLAAAIVASGQ